MSLATDLAELMERMAANGFRTPWIVARGEPYVAAHCAHVRKIVRVRPGQPVPTCGVDCGCTPNMRRT